MKDEMRVLAEKPLNAETPAAALRSWITPNRLFFDRNIIHLPTVKTHVFTTITGAMKNAFGGLLNEKRHWTHSVIHETVVDLLSIQQEIHSGLFAVMDGTFAGDGPPGTGSALRTAVATFRDAEGNGDTFLRGLARRHGTQLHVLHISTADELALFIAERGRPEPGRPERGQPEPGRPERGRPEMGRPEWSN